MKKFKKVFFVSFLCIIFTLSLLTLAACGEKVTKIEITTRPYKTNYTVGETFNPDGLTVTAYFSPDTKKDDNGLRTKYARYDIGRRKKSYGDVPKTDGCL